MTRIVYLNTHTDLGTLKHCTIQLVFFSDGTMTPFGFHCGRHDGRARPIATCSNFQSPGNQVKSSLCSKLYFL